MLACIVLMNSCCCCPPTAIVKSHFQQSLFLLFSIVIYARSQINLNSLFIQIAGSVDSRGLANFLFNYFLTLNLVLTILFDTERHLVSSLLHFLTFFSTWCHTIRVIITWINKSVFNHKVALTFCIDFFAHIFSQLAHFSMVFFVRCAFIKLSKKFYHFRLYKLKFSYRQLIDLYLPSN